FYEGSTLSIISTSQPILNIRSDNGFLTVTTNSTIYAFNQQLALVAQIGQIFGEPLQYTSSLVMVNTLYISRRTKVIYIIILNNFCFKVAISVSISNCTIFWKNSLIHQFLGYGKYFIHK